MPEKSDTMSVRDERICQNLGLVHACCHRYRGRGIDYEDLYQAGCIGLVKAVDRFDESRELKFSTYAVPVILGEIKGIFRNSNAVKVSRALKELSLKITRVIQDFENKNSRDPTISEIAEILSVTPEQVAQAENAACTPISLTAIFEENGQAENDIKAEEFASELVDLIALREVLSQLKENDKELIKLRYFSGLTQSKTAKILGMTQVQVSRKEKSILNEMRLKMVG